LVAFVSMYRVKQLVDQIVKSTVYVQTSVGDTDPEPDPDPQDQHVFGPPGSGFIS
jgi:hypothetical protein